jgi:hypothetical protein
VNRSQLLARLDAAWQDFINSYAGLSDAQLLEPRVTGGAWSIRDLIAHVTIWEEETLKLLPEILQGRRLARYSTTYGSIDAFNHMAIQGTRGLSLSQVLKQQQASHRRLLDLLQTVSEDEFATDTRFRRRLRLDTYGHYSLHAKDIRAWRHEREGIAV